MTLQEYDSFELWRAESALSKISTHQSVASLQQAQQEHGYAPTLPKGSREVDPKDFQCLIEVLDAIGLRYTLKESAPNPPTPGRGPAQAATAEWLRFQAGIPELEWVFDPRGSEDAEKRQEYRRGRGWNWSKMIKDYGVEEIQHTLETSQNENAIRWEKNLAYWLKKEKRHPIKLRCLDY